MLSLSHVPGFEMVLSHVASLEISNGVLQCLWKDTQTKCSMFGLMHQLGKGSRDLDRVVRWLTL
jgi:hypothetical protein